jgi:hypothetical protein
MGGGGEGRWRTGLVCISGGEGRQRTVGDELRRWGTRRVCGVSPLESGLVACGRKGRCRFCFDCFFTVCGRIGRCWSDLWVAVLL